MSMNDLPPSSSAGALTATAANTEPDGDSYPWERLAKGYAVCCMPECPRTTIDCPEGLLLFRLPRDLNKCAEWMKKISDVQTVRISTMEESTSILRGVKICYLHFDPAQIQEAMDESSATGGKKYRLVNEAIPTLNLPPSDLESFEQLSIQN